MKSHKQNYKKTDGSRFKKKAITLNLIQLLSYRMVRVLIIFCFMQLEGIAQSTGIYNLQFTCPNYDVTTKTVCVDIQIVSANNQTLIIGNYNITGSYNTSALSLNEETSYTPLGFAPNINCSSSVSSPYSTVNFSLLGDSLYTIESIINSTACHDVGFGWENVGTLCFNVENEDSTMTQNFSSFLETNFYNENGELHTPEMEIDSNAFTIPEITISKTICEGIEETTLIVEPGFDSYEWMDENGNSISFTNTLIVYEAGTYTLTVSDDLEECLVSKIITIQNGLILEPEDSTICQGDTIVLTANEGFDNYIWSNIDNTEVGGGQIFPVYSSGIYVLQVFDNELSNCLASDTIIITSGGNLAIDVTEDLAICASESTSLDAGAGFENYLWTYENGDTILDTTGSILFVDSIGIYIVQVFDGGCIGKDTIEVSLDESLTIDIIGNLSICGNETTTLSTTTNFDTYEWTTANDSILASSPNLLIDSVGTYTLTVDSAGCVATDTITVNESDNLTISITGNAAICEGGTTFLNATAGFQNYIWINAGGDTMSFSSTLVADTIGHYSVEVSDEEGSCFGSNSVTIDLDESLTVEITNDVFTICEGETVTLEGEADFASYEWTNENNSNVETTQTINVDTAGTYILSATTFEGCSATDTVTLDIINNLPIEIIGNSTICPEGTTILNAGAGFASYTWTEGSNTTVGNEQIFVVDTISTYTVMVWDASGCSGSDVIMISENDNLAVNITGDLMICVGDTTQLDAGIGATYKWFDEDGELLENSTRYLTVSDLGMYIVDVSEDGCTGMDTVIVSGGGDLFVHIAGSETFCTGIETALKVIVDSLDYDWIEGEGTYEWSNQSGATVGEAQILSIDEGSTYTAIVTDANGCTGTDEFTLIPSDHLTVNITGDLIFCEGESTTLTVNGGFEGLGYNWTMEEDETFQRLNSIETITETGTYTVDMIGGVDCSGSTTIIVSEQERPNVVITNAMNDTINEITFCQGAVTLNAVASEGEDTYNYLWSSNQTNPTITVAEPDEYTVMVTGDTNCPTIDTVIVNLVDNLPMTITDNLGNANNITFCQDESVTLEIDIAEGDYIYDYEWSNGDLTPTTIINTPGTNSYTVTVTRDDECSGIDTINLIQLSTTPLTFTKNRFVFITPDNDLLNLYFSFENDVFNIDTIEAEIPLLDSQTLSVIDAFDNGSPIIDSANNSFIVYAPSVDFIGFDSTWVSVCTQSCYTCDSAWIVMGNYGDGDPIETTPMDATSLVEDVLAAEGCVGIDNITFIGNPSAIGYFSQGDSAIGLAEGIVLSTGYVSSMGGQSKELLSKDLNLESISDNDLNILEPSNQSFRDPTHIEFDFTPTTGNIKFEFVFASEEYPDSNQTNPPKNDTFGIFVSGPNISGPFSDNSVNIALVPDSLDYVSVHTINDSINSSFYNDNTGGLDMKFDGFTDVLTASLAVQACETYHIKIVIADLSGKDYDSAVFLKANSLSSEIVAPSISGNLSLYAGENTTLEANANLDYDNYSWSTNETTQAVTVNEVGDYTVTVSNDAGCYCDANVTVSQANTTTAEINLMAYLEGPSANIISIGDLLNGMTNTLQTTGTLLLPQPYNMPPWNYSGTESIVNFNNLGNIVDWVLVELHAIDEQGETTIAGRKAALLQNTGVIITTNGETNLNFLGTNPNKDYHIVLRHRNHLDIASLTAHNLSAPLNLTLTNPSNVMEGNTQLVQVGATAIYAMRAGDFDGNGIFNIDDKNYWQASSPQFNVYALEDCNLDALIFIQDYQFWLSNNPIIGVDIIRY